MNGVQQREHRTVTEGLSKRLDDDETIIEQLITQDQNLRDAGRGVEATIERMSGEMQRCWTEQAQRTASLQAELSTFTSRTFWQRLKWLVRGV